MAILLTGTTIGGNIALHAGNVSTYALTSVPAQSWASITGKPFLLTLNYDQGSAWSGNTGGSGRNIVASFHGLSGNSVITFGSGNGDLNLSVDGNVYVNEGQDILASRAWVTSQSYITSSGSISGNAATATTLQTARAINGTSFNGSSDITTANWGTARTITIGNTGKSVNGGGNVSWSLGEIQAEYEVPLNTLRNNLGSPTVREAALFHGQFNNKFRFLSPTLQEESTDGTTWVTSTRASAAVLGDMMVGEGQGTSFSAIPSAAVGTYGAYRLTWNVVGSTGYVFLNALYIFNSTNGNTVNITIEALHNTNGWVTITGPHATSNWPGHAYIPHSNIPYSNNPSQYSQVRITFTTTHNTNINAFTIYGIEWFGGYPQGRRNAESYDRDRNVYFPASIQGSRLISTVATGTAPLSVTSTTVVGNLNADMVDGYHSSSLWRNDGGSWNPGANILLNQTANNQEWSFDITRNGYTGGYWHVWDSANSTMLKVDAVTGKVSAPYNFVGNLEGSATTLATARTLTIGATGKTFNGSANVSWTLAEIGAQAAGSYAAASHNHDDRYYTETEVGNFFGGTTAITGYNKSNWDTAFGWGNHASQSYATQTYVNTAVSNLVNSAPAALDTLNELAAALGNDSSFSTTITNSIATKAPLASPALTGTPTAPTAATSTNTTQIATTAFVKAQGYSTTTGTVTSVSGTGSYGGLTLSGTVTSSGNITLGGTPTGTWPISVSGNATTATTAGALSSMNISQFTNNSGYITGISFANVSSKPTTISGYGITDAITTANIGSQSVSYATTAGSAPNGSNINSNYDVTAGVGNGLRFWNGSSAYKISMGVGSLYQYGPVSDYSIKMQMNDGDTGRGFVWGRESYAPIAALNSTSGDMEIAGYMKSYGYRGNGNVGGTGAASWHPDGIYCGSTMWQYGSLYKNNTGIYGVSEMTMYSGPILSTYNTRNLIVRALDNNADVGILGQKSGGGFAFQIYGTGTSYGFLNGTWAAWDIRKAINGAMYMNDNDSYYLQTNSTSNFYALNIQGNSVIHAGNIGSQSVSYASSAGSAGSVAWTNVSSRPTALSQFTNDLGNYGGFLTSITAHTHAISDVTGLQTALDGKQAAGSYSLTSHTHADATTSVAGFMSAADKTKLNGIASGATANAGTVTSVSGTGTVSGLTLSGTVTSSGSLTLGGTLSLTSANVTTALGFTPYNATNPSGYITSSGSISGSAGSVTGLTLNSSANGINPDSVTQNQIGYNTSVSLFGQTDGGLYSSAYSSSWIHQIYGDFRTGQIAIRGKNNGTWQAWRTVLDSSNFSTWAAAASHTHTIANITGLQTALDGKQVAGSYAAASHTHTIANVTGLQTALDGKAASSHTHAISDVTGLQTALDGKQASGSYLTTSGKAADSDLLDGLDLHTGRNNEVNKVVRTDVSGYIQAGWINTTSGNTTSTLTDIYVNTNDGYIRKATPAHFRSQITDGVYAPVSHTHTIANVTGLQTALDGKAASSHTHTIANVTGLQTALDGKQASGSYLTTSGKAADSELIDGIDSSRIVYGDGSRGKSISRAGASANASDSTNASGFYFGNNVTGLPTTDYWNWVTVAANSWSGSDGYQFQLAGSFWGDDYRIRRMTSGTNHGWVSLIHSGNIGSQSVSYASTAGSATSATTAGSATIATQLNKFGDIYGQDWNTYYINGKMIVSSVYGGSGPNFPTGAYNYGAMLSYGVTGSDFFQVYFPENGALQGGAFRKLHYRTGWNGSWSAWKSVVDQEGQVCTIAGSNQTGIEIHSNVGYNQDPLTYFLIRGQADTSWKALKVRLTGDAGGQDIEFRRIAENGTDARMWYIPRGANTVNFDYPIVQPSDSRLKDNITPISTPVDKIKSLRGVEFDWNSGEQVGTHDVGLIAQDVEVVLPEAVTTQEDGYKNLAYAKVIPLLVEAMKEQQAMIEALKAEIELLKNK